MMTFPETDFLTVFPSRLGWMAIVGRGGLLRRLTFGHSRAAHALAALTPGPAQDIRKGPWNEALVERLQAYASGARDDFLDVEVDLAWATAFQRRVLQRTRRIPFATTITYGQLAREVGSPGAARAIGRSMAVNPIPLVIPCHRVVAANGSLCGFSAAGGVRTKQQLLELEAGAASLR